LGLVAVGKYIMRVQYILTYSYVHLEKQDTLIKYWQKFKGQKTLQKYGFLNKTPQNNGQNMECNTSLNS